MKIITLLLLAFTINSLWAKPMTHHEFVKLSTKQRVQIIAAYRDFLSTYTDKELEGLPAITLKFPSLMGEAHASFGVDFDCLYQGWPSLRVKGKCTHPKKGNPFYSQGPCSAGELQCQTMIFGSGICADISNQAKRNQAFQQCEEKFTQSGRTLEDVTKGLDLRSTEVNELFSTVKNVCEENKQVICKTLDSKIESIRNSQTTTHFHPEPLSQDSAQNHPDTTRLLSQAAETAGKLNTVVAEVGYQQCSEAAHDHSARDLRSYEDDQNGKDWTLRIKDFLAAPCKTRKPPTNAVINSFLLTLSGKPKGKKINGVKFEKENPKLLKAFEELVHNQEGPKLDIQKEYDINPECKKVHCAVQKIWGPELGKKLLYMKLKHGFNGSELGFKKENFKVFADGTFEREGHYPFLRPKTEHINHILMTLEDLPVHLIPLASHGNQPLGAVDESVPNHSGSLADSAITLWPAWQKGWEEISPEHDAFLKQAALLHELGHVQALREPHGQESPEWQALVNSCQTSIYGATNHKEDFAESFAGYRYNGKDFKQRCPEKYAFMKNRVFGGIEYVSEESCHQK